MKASIRLRAVLTEKPQPYVEVEAENETERDLLVWFAHLRNVGDAIILAGSPKEARLEFYPLKHD